MSGKCALLNHKIGGALSVLTSPDLMSPEDSANCAMHVLKASDLDV